MMSVRRNAPACRLKTCLAGLSAAAVLFASAVLVEAATIPVTTTADEYGTGSGCSLREAVQAANDNAAFGGCPAGEASEVDVIEVPAGLYRLTRGGADEDSNAEGDLDVTESVDVKGLGANLRWKPPFDWHDWNQDEYFPVKTYVSRKILQSLGLDGLDRATRDLGDADALYAQYVTDAATVIANGIGDPGTPGDGDRIFDVKVDGVDLSLSDVAIIDGNVGCTGADCKSGAGAINQTGNGALKLKRVFVADNRSTCFGVGCGSSDVSRSGNDNPESPAGIAAIGGGDLTVRLSVLLRNRSECFDVECDTGHSAISQGLLDGGFLETGPGTVSIRNTAFVANETYCDAAPAKCAAGNTVTLNTEQDFASANVWFIGNTNTCFGFDCGTEEVFEPTFGDDDGPTVSISGLVMADNENYCEGEDCDTDETAELSGGNGTGTVDLSQIVFLRNKNTCEGDDCDTDETFEASTELGAYDLSALFFVKNMLQCFGTACDTDPVYDMDALSLTGLAIVFHRNKLYCNGDCGDLNVWGVDSADTVVSSFLLSDNHVDVDDQIDDGYEIIDITSDGPHLLKDGLVANNRIACGSCLVGTPPNTMMRVAEAATVLRRLTIQDNRTDGVGGAVGSGVFPDGNLAASNLRIINSEITGNTAGEEGGGIFNAADATLRINRSEVTGNTAGTTGGGIFNDGTIASLSETTISGNTPDDCVGCP